MRCGRRPSLRGAGNRGERAQSIEPERGFDCGAGPGKPIERQVRGGTVGLILDARGRPLTLPPATLTLKLAGIVPATLVHPWNEELCASEPGIVCGRDWPELRERLEPVLAGDRPSYA